MPLERVLTAVLIGTGVVAALAVMIAATVTARGGDADGYTRRRAVALVVVLAVVGLVAAMAEWMRAGE